MLSTLTFNTRLPNEGFLSCLNTICDENENSKLIHFQCYRESAPSVFLPLEWLTERYKAMKGYQILTTTPIHLMNDPFGIIRSNYQYIMIPLMVFEYEGFLWMNDKPIRLTLTLSSDNYTEYCFKPLGYSIHYMRDNFTRINSMIRQLQDDVDASNRTHSNRIRPHPYNPQPIKPSSPNFPPKDSEKF